MSFLNSRLTASNTNQPPQQISQRRLDGNDSTSPTLFDDIPIHTPMATFQQNSASEGGAIDASDSIISIDGILFQSNTASERVRFRS